MANSCYALLSADHPATPWLPFALAFVIIARFIFWTRLNRRSATGAAISLAAGGALGNVVDRLRHGAVTDFLDFHADGYHWPAFNIAGSSIFLGVALLIVLMGRGDAARADLPSAG